MFRKGLMTTAAVTAAIGAVGCYPIVSNQSGEQQDVIGGVDVSADVCEAPYVALLFGGGIFRDVRDAKAGNLRGSITDLFGCRPEDEVLDALRSGGSQAAAIALPHQDLVAIRVPEGATAPSSFEVEAKIARPGDDVIFNDRFDDSGKLRGIGASDPVVNTQTLEFTRAEAIDKQINDSWDGMLSLITSGQDLGVDLDLNDDDEQWVGYISDRIDGTVLGEMKLEVPFGLPAGQNGAAYAGPFEHVTLVGSRIAIDEGDESFLASDRAIDCLDRRQIEELNDEGDIIELLASAFCPAPDLFRALEDMGGVARGSDELADLEEAFGRQLTGDQVATRDLALTGGEGYAVPGATASVPFTLNAAGAQGGSLTATATTTLPGVGAQQHTFEFPAAGNHPSPVSIPVPADATPGTYEVTLTVNHEDAVRTAKGTVLVLPKPAEVVAESTQLSRTDLVMGSDGTISFAWTCPPLCGNLQVDVLASKAGIAPTATTAQAQKPRLLRIGRTTMKAKAGTTTRAKVKLFPKARRAVGRGRKVKALMVVRAGGTGTPVVRRVTVRK